MRSAILYLRKQRFFKRVLLTFFLYFLKVNSSNGLEMKAKKFINLIKVFKKSCKPMGFSVVFEAKTLLHLGATEGLKN